MGTVVVVVVGVVVVVVVVEVAAVVVVRVVEGKAASAKGSQIIPAAGLVSAAPLSRMVRSTSHACVGSLLVAPRKTTDTSVLVVTSNHVAPPSTLL